MATKQKISPEDATILKTYGTSPATKRFARDLMLEGKTLEEVIKTCQNIAKKEQEIKNTWYRAMLREMSDQRFDGTTYELQKLLEDKAVVTEKILSRANRHLKELTALGKPKSRELQVFIKILERYLKKISDFNHYAYKLMKDGKSLKEIAAVAAERDRTEQIENEERLWRIQCVHHCQKLFDYGGQVAPLLLEQALDRKGIKDGKTRELQDQLVFQSFSKKGENYSVLKNIDYAYCRDYVLTMKSIHPLLVNFLVADEWVSPETAEFFLDKEISRFIIEAGQASLVYMPFHRMAEEIRKKEKITVIDRNVLTIEGFYDNAIKKYQA